MEEGQRGQGQEGRRTGAGVEEGESGGESTKQTSDLLSSRPHYHPYVHVLSPLGTHVYLGPPHPGLQNGSR